MSDNALLDAAVIYASRYNWAVFPLHHIVLGKCSCNRADCQSPGKHPRTAKGVLDATTEAKQLYEWWQEWPQANVGVATGSKSDIVVLDIDLKSQGPEHWQELLDANGTVDTLTTITGSGGWHWVFKAPEELLKSTASQIAQGLDTRAEGGYIVAPPSNHIAGNNYEWDNKTTPGSLPVWLFDLWPKHQTASPLTNGNGQHSIGDMPHWVSESLANGASENSRNTTAHRLASYFRTKGIPRDVVLTLLQDFAAKCHPPMNLPELQQTIDSAQRYAIQVAEAGIDDPPEFEEHLGDLTYTWHSPGVKVCVEQLHRNRQGIHCEITFDSIGGEQARYIWGPVSYNFTSTSGRATLLKELQKRWDIDWGELLEKLSRMVSAYLRMGEPVKHLRDYMHRPASQWILNPLILENQPSMLFGTGGLGKSLIALAALLAVESGTEILPGLSSEIGHHGIYLDWERTGDYEHGVRYRKILTGAGLSPDDHDVLFQGCNGALSENVRAIKRVIDSEGVTFAIVDSAGFACGGEPEKAEFALQFFEALHQLEVPALVIAHQTKGDTRGMPFGSVFWHNASRSTWEIRNEQTPGDSNIKVGLFNRKSNVGSLSKPLGYDIKFETDTIKFTQFDPRTNAAMAEGTLTVSDQITAYLEEEARSLKDLAELLGKTENQIKNTLQQNKGRFIEVGTHEGAKLWGMVYRT